MRNLLLAFVLAVGGAQAVPQARTGVIEGRVINANTQEPMPSVRVTLVAPAAGSNVAPALATQLAEQTASLIESGIRAGVSQDAIDNAVANLQRNLGVALGPQTVVNTNAEGYFSFKDLAPGRYNLRADREGFFAQPLNGTASPAVTRNITVEAGKNPAPAELALTPGGIISGRVRDPNGQAVSGMQIQAYRVTYSGGRKVWSAASAKATDDRGEYRMFWLPPGEYYVGAIPRTPSAIPGPQDSWARTFFPGVTEPEAATVVAIAKGGESSGIDINIRAGTNSLFKISGTAKNPYAVPNPNGVLDQSVSQFYLVPREPGVLDGVNATTFANALPINARANGEFEIRNVRPGSYDLIPYFMTGGLQVVNGAVAQTPGLRRYMVSHNPVDVRNADVTGLTVSIGPGSTIAGEVVTTGTGAQPIKLESVRVGLRPLPTSTTPQTFAAIIGTLVLDGAGKFSTSNVPQDRYTFAVLGMPDTAFVSDVRQGGASVFDTGAVIDSNPNPVQIVLDAGGVQVDGTVLTAERKPHAAATVALVPAAGRRQNPLLYKSVQSDESGHFVMKGVPPGQYTVYAWESVLPTSWMNADFIMSQEGRGRPLNVERQSHPEIEVNLIPMETKR